MIVIDNRVYDTRRQMSNATRGRIKIDEMIMRIVSDHLFDEVYGLVYDPVEEMVSSENPSQWVSIDRATKG